MAPVKFEEHVREKLNEREIQPSGDSWERLSASMDQESNKKSRFKIWWYAAAVLLVILTGGIFRSLQTVEKSPVFVEQPSEKSKDNIENTRDFITPVHESQIAAEEKELVPAINKQESSGSDKPSVPGKTKMQNRTGKDVLIANRREIATIEIPEPQTAHNELQLENFRNEEIKIVIQQNMSSEAKAEALLAQAMKGLERSNIGSRDIEAMANNLLDEAEEDLDQSFRREVFEIMKEKFIQAKDAIVTRND
ncbi:hypothetical protein [Christiangramia sabulilitoris]|uniref:Uncharacterized protein n=1 Tax=Christiangramia sabulilitoris TaxID=2583991 RepID=A0A550I3T6_9FLAO|nr:hypothetical protein [Christiangramia sabulilitoris]TRO65642.1 hypothetical protein FGM01_09605 [Christiangramia sabulilitoris]